MFQITVKVDGMMCGMCESHINETIRKKFAVKKVLSSHTEGQTVILTEQIIPAAALRETIEDTGYTVADIQTEVYQRKKLLGLF